MPIAEYLRDCGYRVIEAVNSEEAMTVTLHQETVVHLVFSDVEMPGAIDGLVDTRPPPRLRRVVSWHRPSRCRERERTLRRRAGAEALRGEYCSQPYSTLDAGLRLKGLS